MAQMRRIIESAMTAAFRTNSGLRTRKIAKNIVLKISRYASVIPQPYRSIAVRRKSGRGLMCRGLFASVVFVISTFAISTVDLAAAPRLTDDQVRHAIIRECRAIYHKRKPCACPYDRPTCSARRNAYENSDAGPFCFPKDVSGGDIIQYRKGDASFIVKRCAALE